ncbi:hypothetical protein B0H67DRAFT_650041 [Lasiosphaeris hirsuta]|uniref:Uncharacterized protein n=1 Tax=Lasiosphaeris hirsuta TaxID=260670 RepID=A0AA39ZS80_9PEZI|nr:hypothetical protein B0H67DRAFT_650041 [Lasiosphaeris hirsuta]
MNDPPAAREDEPLLEGRGDEPRPRGDGRGFISFAGVVILIAVVVASIAVLLGLNPEIGQIGQPETSPPPPPVTEPVKAIEPVGIRIEYNELLRPVDPNITFSAFDAQLESFGIRGIDPAIRTGAYT